MTPDSHYVVGVGYDAAAQREQVRVYHLAKGVFLHKISLRYQNFKEMDIYNSCDHSRVSVGSSCTLQRIFEIYNK